MTELVRFVFTAGGAIVVLLVAAAWLFARPASRQARRFLLVAGVTYGVLSLYGVSYSAGRLLVTGLRPLERSDVPEGRTAIVVLGSGTFTARDWNERRFSVLDEAAASRVLEAARVFNLVDATWVISSGGLVRPTDADEPSGETMRDALVNLGVPASQILVETMSRDTHDEATIVGPMLMSLQIANVILVTSDTHMRRSIGAFRAVGIDAIPAIARHPHVNAPWFVPSEGGLDEAGRVVHEALGMIYYAVRGWYTTRSPVPSSPAGA